MKILRIANIRTNGGTQPRAALDTETTREYAEAMSGGAEFPAVTVFYDGEHYWLADGFHRVKAAHQIGREEIAADVRQGSRRDAILHSVGANAQHGLRRTNEDKRRAVMTLLRDDEWKQWPDAQVARQCGVGRHFVRKIRDEITWTPSTSEPEYRKYIDKYGNERVMNVANIGRSRSKQRPLTDDEAALLSKASSPSVYVIESGSRVKIGWSRSVASRVQTILTQNPEGALALVAEGGNAEERAIHNALVAERDVGEWFLCSVADVSRIMDELGITYTTKHGTTATMNTQNIGRRSQQAKPGPEACANSGPDLHCAVLFSIIALQPKSTTRLYRCNQPAQPNNFQ
jgi:uncharacterized ParB-like nuclease family protein